MKGHSAAAPLHAFPEWGKETLSWPGTNVWPTQFPALPPAAAQQEAITNADDKDGQTVHATTSVTVKDDNPQQGSVSPTQLDVEDHCMQPEAKRANVGQETLDINKHDDVFSMEEHHAFMELLKEFRLSCKAMLEASCNYS